MRLQALDLYGFKSFADRTTLEFRDGVTAIVGSNGCGKSNIADSIRWVLGEQRASAVRGSKMEEVIFQGTTRRRPVNFAEVALRFENHQGRVAIPQTEVEVARKVFREGGSEYSLNRNSCRLRDIHNLLRDTGLGSNAYAVIEAGMIETLLSDRAEERRMLFEEAAGIGRYKDSRHAATRRLESAEADLARLEDLVAEVESKVRSLSRQKRRAEQHSELRSRQLELEVWITEAEISALREALERSEARRAELDEAGRMAGASRGSAELRIEQRRVELTMLVQERLGIASRLEQVRARLDAREREILIAEERASHGELRIGQLVRERAEVEARRGGLAQELARLETEGARHLGVLEELRGRLAEHAEGSRVLRSGVARERTNTDEAGARARGLAREVAAAEGERSAAERRERELEARAAEVEARQRDLHEALEDLAQQAALSDRRAADMRERVAEAAEDAAAARTAIQTLQAEEQTARLAVQLAESRRSRLVAQVEARETVERAYEGFAPAITALMAERARFPGVLGPLADFIPGNVENADALEAHLGPLLQALVVADLEVARGLRGWFRSEWQGGGSLLLLPLDAVGRQGNPAAWVEILLRDLVIVDGDPLAHFEPGVTRVGPDGVVIDGRGVVRLGESTRGQGILARREELARLRSERDEAALSLKRSSTEWEARFAALRSAEDRAVEAEESRRVAESELRRVEADAAAHRHQDARLRQDREQLLQTMVALEEASVSARQRATEMEHSVASLTAAVAQASAAEEASRARLRELEARWENVRDEEAELRVASARAEGEQREAERRRGAALQSEAAAASRLASIDREAAELRDVLEGLGQLRERAGAEIQALFEARDREGAELTRVEAVASELEAEVAELTQRVSAARRTETVSATERHELDLHIADMRSRAERLAERVEVEWSRPWPVLRSSVPAPTSGNLEVWRTALRDARSDLEALGPVNMLAVDEHAEEEQRLNFLLEQRADLVEARDDLVAAIRQINRTAREVFMSTFQSVRTNFRRVFQSLFEGGECDIWLAEPDDPLESTVEIHASPKGKRSQRIHLLSGGERTLTALALLFGLYLVKPSPFCVLDEVDAPLDESNVGRFIQLLQDFKADTQFIVITHNPRTMEAADWVYGVTMEEAGVSSIVGVELLGSWQPEGRVA
ncbi:MAG: chromosome segregation protein SMC [Gemmatimonadetes bacterium]|nr:chromosome segregation protein SMC [Gemmatimonadota bacterium]